MDPIPHPSHSSLPDSVVDKGKIISSIHDANEMRKFLSREFREEASEELLQNILKGTLTELDLSKTSITQADLALVLHFCPMLEKLSVSQTSISDLSCLMNCQKLTAIDLSYCRKLTPSSFSVLSKILQLTLFACEGCFGLVDEAMPHLGNCLHLKHLDISECTNLTDDGMQHLPHSLEFLSLRNIPCLTEKTLTSVSNCLSLTGLDISQTNFPLHKLFQISVLERLQHLALWQCRLLKDDDLMWLQDRCMQNVDISHCPRITDASLAYLTNVASLSLDHCIHLTDEGMQILAQSAALKKLSIAHCPSITSKGLAFFSSKVEVLFTAQGGF